MLRYSSTSTSSSQPQVREHLLYTILVVSSLKDPLPYTFTCSKSPLGHFAAAFCDLLLILLYSSCYSLLLDMKAILPNEYEPLYISPDAAYNLQMEAVTSSCLL